MENTWDRTSGGKSSTLIGAGVTKELAAAHDTIVLMVIKSIHKQTKIVCTIGPSSSAQGTLEDMVRAGMDVARINFSHGDYESNLVLLEKVRAVARAAKKPIGIMQDLQGPKIRVGVLPQAGLELIDEKIVTLHAGVTEAEHGVIPVPYKRFAHDVSRGDRLLLDDGTKELEVLSVKGSRIKAKVIFGGHLISHKGINVPSVALTIEAMTEKDEADLTFGLKQNIDFVALSFVRTGSDVVALRKLISEKLPADTEPPAIIAKIEKHEALDNFDDILNVADGIMIARGDLGLETPASAVPIHQKELIAKCVVAGKPVITATEMLDSMQKRPRPSRAEVSDVANSVIDHTDATMLSGETAMGLYPVRSVEIMSKIIADTEESTLDNLMPERESVGEPVPSAVAAAAVKLSRHINAAAILVTTHSGFTARQIARFRPDKPIIAATDSPRTRQQLTLSWGITPIDVDGYDKPETLLSSVQNKLKKIGLKKGETIVVVAGLRRLNKYDSAIRVVEL